MAAKDDREGHPRPAPGVRLFIVGDEGVLFSPTRQELYGINPTATLIWCCIEEGMSVARIVGTLRENSGIGLEAAHGYVRDAVASWRASGMLEGGEANPPATPVPSDPWIDPAVAAGFPPVGDAWVRQRRYRLLDSSIAVRFTASEQDAVVDPVLVHLTGGDDRAPDVVVDVAAADGRLFVYRDGEPAAVCDGIDALAPIVKHTVWRLVLDRADFFLDIHAGVVGNGKGCLLLPAAPGSGKSTLTAALVHAGWEFLSDEVALLDPGTFHVRPMPMAFCVKSTGFAVAARFFPDLDRLPVHRRGDGKLVRYIRPRPESLGRDLNQRFPVVGIVFPRYEAGAETRLTAISPVESLRRIMEECLILRAPLDDVNVAGLVRWIETVPCRELITTQIDRAVHLIETEWPRT